MNGRAPITDEELEQWATLRADDAGHLARELITHRRAAPRPQTSSPSVPSVDSSDDPAEFPDISEMIEAMREAVCAGDAYNAFHPDELKTADDEPGRRWDVSFEALRALVAECDAATEAFSSPETPA